MFPFSSNTKHQGIFRECDESKIGNKCKPLKVACISSYKKDSVSV